MLKIINVYSLVFMAIVFSECIKANNLVINKIYPEPNYKYKAILSDVKKITDGKIERFPMWTKSGSLGWVSKTPVSIEINNKNNSNKYSTSILRIHSAKGLYAGVDLPRQIDVYQIVNGKYQFINSVFFKTDDYSDKEGHWLDVPLYNKNEDLMVVINSSSKYLFIDEILIVDMQGVKKQVNNDGNSLSKKEAIKDSVSRLKLRLENKIRKKSNDIKILNSGIYSWIQNPWGVLKDTDRPKFNDEVEIFGFNMGKEAVCIAVLNREEEKVSFRLQYDKKINSDAIKVNKLLPVLAANGEYIYDVIKPIKNIFNVKGDNVEYIWLSLDLSKMKIGDSSYNIELYSEKDNKLLKKFKLMLTNIDIGSSDFKTLKAINWAYSDDMPIWKNEQVKLLSEYGVNVFVVHPRNIPGLKLDGDMEKDKIRRFENNIEMFKGAGKILFYLGWSSKNNPFNSRDVRRSISIKDSIRLKRWVREIAKLIKVHGLTFDQWAIYPIDEPRGKEHLFLKKLAAIVKQVNPSINIYANSASSNSEPTGVSDIIELNGLVDIWQPHLELAKGKLSDYLNNTQGSWWIYHNPKSPAKAASPLRDYRKTSWWAWHLGAKGVGFWSFSDTGGSSAWDDFDGYRPDWAVVYESENGVLSSRRWEAFRDGLEDYKLLSISGISYTDADMQEDWTWSDFQKRRRAIILKLKQEYKN